MLTRRKTTINQSINSPAGGLADGHSPALYNSKFFGVYLCNSKSTALIPHCGRTQKVIALLIIHAISPTLSRRWSGGTVVTNDWCIMYEFSFTVKWPTMRMCYSNFFPIKLGPENRPVPNRHKYVFIPNQMVENFQNVNFAPPPPPPTEILSKLSMNLVYL